MTDASPSHLYGKGVFTTIRIIDGKPWLWEKHWRRLMHDAERLGIDTSPYSEYMVQRGIDESIPDADKLTPLKARITISDLRPSPLWSNSAPEVPSNVEFLVSPLSDVPRPFRLGVSPYPVNSRSPLAGLKTCNYLDNILALDEAKTRGFNEAMRVNECGLVTSASMANLFWLKDERLFTPALSTGCLNGTTREFVMENIGCEEIEVGLDELRDVDAIYLTSAGLGVVAVNEFDGGMMSALDHPILSLIPETTNHE